MSLSVRELPIDQLSVDDRLELLGRLWDSLLEDGAPPPMPAWHLEEVNRRIALADANPQANVSLDDLRQELRGQRS